MREATVCDCFACYSRRQNSSSIGWDICKGVLGFGLILAVVVLAVFALGCSSNTPTQPETVPAPSAVVSDPGIVVVAPTPKAPELPPSDYLSLQGISVGAQGTARVHNKDNGTGYVVHACMYTPKGAAGRLISQDQGAIAPGGDLVLKTGVPGCEQSYQLDVALQECSQTPVFSPGYFIGFQVGETEACAPPPPRCNDKVTTAGHLTISVSHAGDYQINGGALFPLGANSVTTIDYPVDGSAIVLTTPQDRYFKAKTVASCGDVGASWHGSLTFSCTTQHSCPQTENR